MSRAAPRITPRIASVIASPTIGSARRHPTCLMNSRQLQVENERDPVVTDGFLWAARSRTPRLAHPVNDRVVALGIIATQSLNLSQEFIRAARGGRHLVAAA